MAKTRKQGKGFLELCPNCMGELVFKGAMIAEPELFHGLQCKECKRCYAAIWQYKGWKEIDRATLRILCDHNGEICKKK